MKCLLSNAVLINLSSLTEANCKSHVFGSKTEQKKQQTPLNLGWPPMCISPVRGHTMNSGIHAADSSASSSCGRKPRYPERKSFGLNLRALVFILFACTLLAGCGSTTPLMSGTGNGSKPTINSFAASPGSINAAVPEAANSSSSITLSWATSGATSIAITPGTFTSTSASGSTVVSPTATTTYTLTATNAAGSVTSTQTITVNAGSVPSISSFAASLTTIHYGSSITLSWATSGATSIAITPGTFTSTSASGSTVVSPTATTAYTLTATDAAGSVTSSQTITVAGSVPAISSLQPVPQLSIPAPAAR